MYPYFATSSGELQVSFWYVSILGNTVEGRMVQIPKLREWREARALTQVELAELADLSSRSVAGYEAGAGARPPTVRRLAEALGVEVADLRGVPERPPLGPAPPSQELTLNGELEEQRRTAWESAVENARGLRESGQTRMTELLSLWRASRERQEDADARLEYRNEMADLLTQARKAGTDLFRNFTGSSPEARRAYKEAKKAGAREVPNADWGEFLEADRFYYRLLGMVEGQQGLFVWQDSKQNAFEIVEEAA
jgi:transcriptional regulator with XRE-family HTH domain